MIGDTSLAYNGNRKKKMCEWFAGTETRHRLLPSYRFNAHFCHAKYQFAASWWLDRSSGFIRNRSFDVLLFMPDFHLSVSVGKFPRAPNNSKSVRGLCGFSPARWLERSLETISVVDSLDSPLSARLNIWPFSPWSVRCHIARQTSATWTVFIIRSFVHRSWKPQRSTIIKSPRLTLKRPMRLESHMH